MNYIYLLKFILISFFLIGCNIKQDKTSPFYIKSDLFDHSNDKTLGLSEAPNSKTFTIYHPKDSTEKYSNGAVLMSFKGHLYAQWQSSKKDEDASDTWVVYSRSSNGVSWVKPMKLTDKWEKGICTSGGWWTDNQTLVAYINVWPNQKNPKGGFTEYMTSIDGIKWSTRKPLMSINNKSINGIFEQDPHKLPDGRIICAIHEQPGMIVKPYFTDDPLGIKGWTKGSMTNLPFEGTVSREIEPSWFYQANGNIVMIFRDQASSFKKLASVSIDRGKRYSTPVLTNMPDSRSKQCAGNLLDGTAFMVNNPNNNKNRYPLVITLSKDGKYFNKAYLLRKGGEDLQPLRYNGKFKRSGYHYPKAIIWNNFLCVSYTTNKEDVEITLVPLTSLIY